VTWYHVFHIAILPAWRRTAWQHRFPQLSYCCVTSQLSRRRYVYRAMLRNGRLCWLNYFGFQQTWHIAPSLRLLVPSSLQAYRHFLFSERTRLWLTYSSWRMELQRLAGGRISSGSDSIQASFLVGWFSLRRLPGSPAGTSLGPLVSSAMVLSRAHHPQRASATGGLFSPIPAPSLGVILAFSLQLYGRPWNQSLLVYPLPPGFL
jgi:hypothetical protein